MKTEPYDTLFRYPIFGLLLLMTMQGSAAPIRMSPTDAAEAAPLVAALLVAGRSVVSAHQERINDPQLGNKQFTPDYVDRLIREEFATSEQKIEDIANPQVRRAIEDTLAASRFAIQTNQKRINRQGVAFKGFIPAVYGRVTGNVLRGRAGIDIKQTTFKFRNEYNRPDEYEAKMLTKFEQELPKQGFGEMVESNYRYMQPLYIEESCLTCHGDPKGELDITGKPKEGYKLGELRGAISINIPIR